MKSTILLPLLWLLASLNPDWSFAQSRPSNEPVAQPSNELVAPPSNEPVAHPPGAKKWGEDYWRNQFREISQKHREAKLCLEALENREIKYSDIKACFADRNRYIVAPKEIAPILLTPNPTTAAHSLVATPSGTQAASGSPTYDELQRENTFLKSKSGAAVEAYNQYYYETHLRSMADLRRGTFAWQAGHQRV